MLSTRQEETYRFIRRYLAEHGRAPVLEEIAAALGIRSRGVAHRYVQALADAGLLVLERGRHRGIRLAGADPERPGRLPLLGRIAAGQPIEAIPDQEEIDLTTFFMGPNRFVLRVQGDSMIEDGILPDDMVIVESRQRARNGEIVVALIDREEATLKRIRYNPDGSITLIPANARLQPITYPGERVQVQGVVVGQMRSYR